MTDYKIDSINYNNFNDGHNIIVSLDCEKNFGEWDSYSEYVKIFEPDQINDAENYAYYLRDNIVKSKKEKCEVTISFHKSFFPN